MQWWENEKIIYANLGNGKSEIYSVDISNEEHKNLSNNKSWNGYPALSPDEKLIAFVSNRYSNLGLFIMDPDRPNVLQILNFQNGDVIKPVWPQMEIG